LNYRKKILIEYTAERCENIFQCLFDLNWKKQTLQIGKMNLKIPKMKTFNKEYKGFFITISKKYFGFFFRICKTETKFWRLYFDKGIIIWIYGLFIHIYIRGGLK